MQLLAICQIEVSGQFANGDGLSNVTVVLDKRLNELDAVLSTGQNDVATRLSLVVQTVLTHKHHYPR